MVRTAFSALVGWLIGLGLTIVILWGAERAIRQMTAPKIFEIEYSVIYLTLVIGSGFGGLCGALAGLVGALLRGPRGPNSLGNPGN